MIKSKENIDIKENFLIRKGRLLDLLLFDQTTKKNIIWATDSYIDKGKGFYPLNNILPDSVTGIYSNLIQPRASKNKEEQKKRTKDRAEVFTPLNVVDKMNKYVQFIRPTKHTWQDFVKELKLEITCGEAPFIVSRYNPTAKEELLPLPKRVGFLDKKLSVVSKYCVNSEDWLKWSKIAYMASYGYEWQGDNLLIARENLLYSFIDYYENKFKKIPTVKLQEEFAEIISWNIFQMDGLKYVVPMSCVSTTMNIQNQIPLELEHNNISKKTDTKKILCKGCKLNKSLEHNGVYVKIMDWELNKKIRFVDLIRLRN